jgi:hypothetical protein
VYGLNGCREVRVGGGHLKRRVETNPVGRQTWPASLGCRSAAGYRRKAGPPNVSRKTVVYRPVDRPPCNGFATGVAASC